MKNLEGLVATLARLTDAEERNTFVRQHPLLTTVEGARVICRSSVALTSSDLTAAGVLCAVLDEAASDTTKAAILGYRDHARAALLHQTGSDHRQAAALWRSAIEHFDDAGLPNEAAISSSCGLHDLSLLGDTELLWKCESRARSYFEAHGDRLRLARLRSNVATIFFARAEWRAAASLWEIAYEDFVAEKFGGAELIANLSNLSACYVHLGELPRATFLLERARQLCQERGFDPDLAKINTNLASTRLLEGDLVATLNVIQEQLERGTILPDTRVYYLAALIESEVLLDLCLPLQAHQKASFAYQGLKRIGILQEAAKALLVCGRSLATCHRLTAALTLFNEAKTLFLGIDSTQGARLCDIESAKALLDMGALQSSSALVEAILNSPGTTWVEIDLDCRLLEARVLLAHGEVAQARRLGEEVLARSALYSHNSLEGKALRFLGEVYEALGLLDLAQSVLSRCQWSIDSLRRGLPTGELQIAFLSDKADLYQSLFSVALSSGKDPERLFHVVETSKSRALAESLALQQAPRAAAEDGRSSGLFELWKGLRVSLNQIERLDRGYPQAAQVAPIRYGVLAAERATRNLLAAISERDSDNGGGLPGLREIVSCLPEHSALVEFYLARGDLFAFVVSNRGLDIRKLGPSAPIRHLCRLAMFSLQGANHARQEWPDRALLAYLEELHDVLWSSVSPAIAEDRIVLVPHGFLHQFPFHALFDGQSFLADRHAITYAPSASVFCMSRKRPRQRSEGSIVVGLADTSTPAIADEVRDVARILPHSQLFLNGVATRERLAERLPTARFIHIASHGGFDSADPQASSVHLGDGPVTVHDLQRMELSAELVVLSGCETGRAALRGCDELVGLTQALLQAGARSALVSLWRIADRATAAFMPGFYDQLNDDLGRDQSLRRAMARQKEAFPHPSLWAPFVLVGDPGPGLSRQETSDCLASVG